jgi:hypothetical protein
MTVRTRSQNRPPGNGAATIYLTTADLETARSLGNGNVSAGVRLALEEHRLRQPDGGGAEEQDTEGENHGSVG